MVPIQYDDTLFSDLEGTLEWLNTPGTDENREAIRRALRRKDFKLPSSSQIAHTLETEDY